MFIIIIVFDYVSACSSPVSSQDLYCSLPRDQSRDVTPGLGIFLILQCRYFLSRMHLHSGYYYYDYVVICVLRLEIYRNFLLNLLLSKEVKQLVIIIICTPSASATVDGS